MLITPSDIKSTTIHDLNKKNPLNRQPISIEKQKLIENKLTQKKYYEKQQEVSKITTEISKITTKNTRFLKLHKLAGNPPLSEQEKQQAGLSEEEVKKLVELEEKKKTKVKEMNVIWEKVNREVKLKYPETFTLKEWGEKLSQANKEKAETLNVEERIQKIASLYKKLEKQLNRLKEKSGEFSPDSEEENINSQIKSAIQEWNETKQKSLDSEEMKGWYAKENSQIKALKNLFKEREEKKKKDNRHSWLNSAIASINSQHKKLAQEAREVDILEQQEGNEAKWEQKVNLGTATK